VHENAVKHDLRQFVEQPLREGRGKKRRAPQAGRWAAAMALPHVLNSLLKPFPGVLIAAHEVSNRMDNPKYDVSDCSAPVEG